MSYILNENVHVNDRITCKKNIRLSDLKHLMRSGVASKVFLPFMFNKKKENVHFYIRLFFNLIS
jgi:hypothetical protein